DALPISELIETYAEGTPAEDIPPETFLDGLLVTAFLPLAVQKDDPWIEFYREIHDEYNEKTPFADTTVYGMVQATLLAQVLMDIGPDLNRDELLETLERRAWEGHGLVAFSASD